MKTSKIVKKNIRDEVSRIILSSIYSDKKLSIKWILTRFEDRGLPISLDGLVELSADYSAFLAPHPYSYNTKQIYKVMGFEDIMTYTQFIFELPRIWYTTLYRLIIEWRDEFCEDQDMAY
jgi:hypothetical protein